MPQRVEAYARCEFCAKDTPRRLLVSVWWGKESKERAWMCKGCYTKYVSRLGSIMGYVIERFCAVCGKPVNHHFSKFNVVECSSCGATFETKSGWWNKEGVPIPIQNQKVIKMGHLIEPRKPEAKQEQRIQL